MLDPSDFEIIVGPPLPQPPDNVDVYVGVPIDGDKEILDLLEGILEPSTGSGDVFGFNFDLAGPMLYVPAGYDSGDSLFGTSIYRIAPDTEFIPNGDYEFVLGDSEDADFIINVKDQNVPLPAPIVLIAGGLTGLLVRKSFERKKAMSALAE